MSEPLREQAQKVKAHLQARIIRADLAEGARIDPDELRRQTGATVRSVRQALREMAREGLLHRRQRLGTFVSRGVARAGTAQLPEVRSIALLSSLAETALDRASYTRDLLVGIRLSLHPPGRIEFVANKSDYGRSLDDLPEVNTESLRSRVQGVIATEANHAGALNDLARGGIPIVAVDFHAVDAAFDSVGIDYEGAGFIAASHLVALGHRRIGFIGERGNPHSNDPTWQDRLAGYLRAIAWAAGEEPRPLVLGGPRDDTMLIRDLPDFHRRHRPTGYVVCSGGFAPTLLRVLKSEGVECPRDVSLVCADGSSVKVGGVNLSYVRTDHEQCGRMAVRLLASRIACRGMPPVRVLVPASLIAGDSSRAC